MKNTIKTLLIIAFTVIIGVYFVGCPVPEPDPYAPTPGLEFMLINNGTAYSVSKGTAKAAIVVIPAIYEGKPVIEIADSGFSSYTNMTSIIIPDGVTRIGSYAFFHCDNLTSIVIPAGVTNIGNFAFSNCGSLTSVFYGGADTLKYSTITISSNNAPLESAVRYYYSESIPDTINTHWRFVDGAPLVWNLIINTHPVEVTNAFIGHIYDSLFVEAIIAEGTTLSYQWYINTTNSNVGGTAIAGATSANFTIPTTLAVGTYYYFCQVSTTNGVEPPIRTSVAMVNVLAVPVITTPVINIFTSEDISRILTVQISITSNAALSYQWYSNTENSNIGGSIIIDATSASFTIPTTLTIGTYYYFCEVSINGEVALLVRTNVAQINVYHYRITINSQPAPTVVFTEKLSGNLTVTASVTGDTELNYQWYSNTTNSYTSGTIITSATNANYTIPMTHPVGTYYYFCEVSAVNALSVRTNVVRVSVISSITPIEMVQVPGGSFELGRNLGTGGGSDVTPVSTVNITGFYMGKYQVTQAQFEAVMGYNPSWFDGGSGRRPASGEVQERRPVEQVNWYVAIVFCNRLSIMEGLTPAYRISGSTNPNDWGTVPTSRNATWDAVQIVSGSTGYRLPTEAQWEYAAKGGNGSPGNFTYSGSNDPNAVAWYSANSESRTHEVGKKAPNGLGIYDMNGNVSEWCWDWWGSYTSETKTDPMGASGSLRVHRGGGWLSSSTVTSRSYEGPRGHSQLGFRVSRP